MPRAGWWGGMLSASKLCQSSSTSGPSATSKPMETKMSSSSWRTCATRWRWPRAHRAHPGRSSNRRSGPPTQRRPRSGPGARRKPGGPLPPLGARHALGEKGLQLSPGLLEGLAHFSPLLGGEIPQRGAYGGQGAPFPEGFCLHGRAARPPSPALLISASARGRAAWTAFMTPPACQL